MGLEQRLAGGAFCGKGEEGMIRVQQLKLPVGHTREELEKALLKELGTSKENLKAWSLRKQSLDARKRPVSYVYTIDAEVAGEEGILKRGKKGKLFREERKIYRFPGPGSILLRHPPVIVGSGPAGLFCGLMLARAGYRPILLERGETAGQRKKTVEHFWKTGELKKESNVQFGEGGAGTFSDGKLNTLVKDPAGRNRLVLETFVEAGAPEEILYQNKPHLGTDLLVGIVEHIREEILSLGGQVWFESRMTEIRVDQGRVKGLTVCKKEEDGEQEVFLEAETLVLAVGHSARDTFAMLERLNIPMEPKAFAVGVRIEHPQSMINRSQYGTDYPRELPAAAYKLTRKASSGRGVYSFCMCPGGYVVNASSEERGLAVNGMSYQARDGRNANSAMIVTVQPEDFGSSGVLSGVSFQRRLEEAAYRAGGGEIPVQLLSDFCQGVKSRTLGEVEPCIKGGWKLGDVRGIFPESLAFSLKEGILGCEGILKGFARGDALLSGVESRTSSPVRILRNHRMESSVEGLYPCGEGAGYAGGITSAAMDGIRAAEALAGKYRPC